MNVNAERFLIWMEWSHVLEGAKGKVALTGTGKLIVGRPGALKGTE